MDESLAFIARSRTRAIGAVPSNLQATPPGANGRVNLNAVYGFGLDRKDHSGQFQRDIQDMYCKPDGTPAVVPLYRVLMNDLRVGPLDPPQ